MLRISRDLTWQIGYVRINEGPIERQIEMQRDGVTDVILDMGLDGRIIGVEFLDWEEDIDMELMLIDVLRRVRLP